MRNTPSTRAASNLVLLAAALAAASGCQRASVPPDQAAWARAALERNATLQVVATDHCSFTTKQKELGLGDFTKIPNGTGGLEDRMPVLWTYGVDTGRLTMNEFVAVTSTNSARILNMYPRKGAIVPGADADIAVWDPKANKTITARTQVSVIDYNVFEGTKVTGLPRYTLSRGDVVFRDGTVQAELGRGRFVKREPFAADARALRKYKEFTAVQGVAR